MTFHMRIGAEMKRYRAGFCRDGWLVMRKKFVQNVWRPKNGGKFQGDCTQVNDLYLKEYYAS